jgi:hypothetical protein
VKWPLIVAAALLTLVLVRRSGYVPPSETEQALAQAEPDAT